MKQIIISIRMLAFMTIVTGVVYPLIVTAVAQGIFRHQAGGSLVQRNGSLIGSELLAQKFEGEKFFWPRPSAVNFDAASSGASSLGQASADLKRAYDERVTKLKSAHADQTGEPPQDLLFASGSGLDPHISPQAAYYQLNRVAKARNMAPNSVRNLLAEATDERQFGILGEPRVNVLKLNASLERKRNE